MCGEFEPEKGQSYFDSKPHKSPSHKEISEGELLAYVRELETEILELKDQTIGMSTEITELHSQLELRQRNINLLTQQVDDIKTSSTWRIGRLLLSPVRAVKWAARRLSS